MTNSGLSSISSGHCWSRCSQAADIPAACAPTMSATGLSPTKSTFAGGMPRQAAAWKMAGSGLFEAKRLGDEEAGGALVQTERFDLAPLPGGFELEIFLAVLVYTLTATL